jgi:hypothetical protein
MKTCIYIMTALVLNDTLIVMVSDLALWSPRLPVFFFCYGYMNVPEVFWSVLLV